MSLACFQPVLFRRRPVFDDDDGRRDRYKADDETLERLVFKAGKRFPSGFSLTAFKLKPPISPFSDHIHHTPLLSSGSSCLTTSSRSARRILCLRHPPVFYDLLQARLLVPWKVYLGDVSGDHRLDPNPMRVRNIFICSGVRVLGFIQDDEGVIQRTPLI